MESGQVKYLEVEKLGKNNESWKTLFKEAISLHKKAVDGDKEAVNQAANLLEKVRMLAPGNNLVEAYYGSVTSLMGRDAKQNKDRLNITNQGLKILDEAVKNEPDNTEIRLLRAYVCYRVPEKYFHRTKTAIEDFNYLVSQYEKDSTIFTEELFWKILFDLGMAYKETNQKNMAKSVWMKLLTKTTDPKYGDLLKKEKLKAKNIHQVSNSKEKHRET
jgi:tetratricopeptide (TPR) repeat protein